MFWLLELLLAEADAWAAAAAAITFILVPFMLELGRVGRFDPIEARVVRVVRVYARRLAVSWSNESAYENEKRFTVTAHDARQWIVAH